MVVPGDLRFLTCAVHLLGSEEMSLRLSHGFEIVPVIPSFVILFQNKEPQTMIAVIEVLLEEPFVIRGRARHLTGLSPKQWLQHYS